MLPSTSYPETAGRSLEEIDVIFAKGYVEKVSYVKMAHQMPRLGHAEIEEEWRRLGLADEEQAGRASTDA